MVRDHGPRACFLDSLHYHDRFPSRLNCYLDQETAVYLSTALPVAWLATFDTPRTFVSKITDALQKARLDNPSMVFEERVARAVNALESSLPAPP